MRWLFAVLVSLAPCTALADDVSRPNILWFVVDDMSANFACYGEKLIETPHVDRLAREGTRFSRAFVTAPVCSACRSALITGMYQTSIGAHNHRSGRGQEKIHLPKGVTPAPRLFQMAGYFTCIGDGLQNDGKENKLGKTDYNFEWDLKMYDGEDWGGRRPDQPFFMQVQLAGGKLRGGTSESAKKLSERARQTFGTAIDPQAVTLPPYYPRHPVLLEDWAAYLDAVRFTDAHVGQVIARLEKEGLLDRTLVIFMTDHGISHARGKQFLYDEGTHIPFIMCGPGIPKGVVSEEFVQQIDMAPTSLAACHLPIPQTMQGRDILNKNSSRDDAFAARDRCDETVDKLRSVRNDRWLYIRNFLPQRPLLQPNRYKDGKAIVQTLRSLHAAGELSELQDQVLFSSSRPTEELYEWKIDRFQTKNLVADPAHEKALAEMRARLDRWMTTTNDLGREPESEKMYDSDMMEYLGDKQDPTVIRNIKLMKQWANEGK